MAATCAVILHAAGTFEAVCGCYLIKIYWHFIRIKDSVEKTNFFRRHNSRTATQLNFGLGVN